MGDRIAQLIFEKIKTPEIKETNNSEGTGWGMGSYGSTGINAAQDVKSTESSSVAVTKIIQSDSDQNTDANQEKKRKRTNDRAQNETPLS